MTHSPVDPEWETEFQRWLVPFQECLGRKSRERWLPIYVRGQMTATCRRCATTMARELVPEDEEQLHHFVSTSPWDCGPLEVELVRAANALVGGSEAYLIIDDTGLVKKGTESVGVARQYCGELGKEANCQSLVSLTLARGEVPVPIGLRLFLPESWDADKRRRQKCRVPEGVRHRPKWQIALEEVDRVRAAGAQFGEILVDAGYGVCEEFRHGLSERTDRWTVGITASHQVYPSDVTLRAPKPGPSGRKRTRAKPSVASVSAKAMIESLGPEAFRTVKWRQGTKGPLRGRFATVRVRLAEGPKHKGGKRDPGQDVWLICEEREGGERKYYVSNRNASTPRRTLVGSAKGRWPCEQGHQQMKQELGLDHYEGRSWMGLHHHCLLTMIAFAFLQHLRLAGKKNSLAASRHRAPRCRKSGAD
jgi:SRSO17 transposase